MSWVDALGWAGSVLLIYSLCRLECCGSGC